jgi:adenylate cyclase
LGHLTYSAFLQDFFFDVNMAALTWRGEIYQYVGDEVIVSWPTKIGTDEARCVRCFFDMSDIVEKRRDEYMERYGVCPSFRGGMHGGTVVVTWVGEIKKEIVYHGDVLNTASRIQAESKSGPFSCLVSGELLDQLTLPAEFTATPVGEVALRGKERALPLFGLEHVV